MKAAKSLSFFPSNLDFQDSIIVGNAEGEFGEKKNLFHNLFMPDVR
jgi:hypothetical protein